MYYHSFKQTTKLANKPLCTTFNSNIRGIETINIGKKYIVPELYVLKTYNNAL